ncbi:hypothetical protein ACKVWC_000208 [Pyricularia oryzae]
MEVILDAVRTAAHSTDPLEVEEIKACIKQIKTILLVRKKVSSLNKKLGLRKLLTRLYSHQPDELVLPFKRLHEYGSVLPTWDRADLKQIIYAQIHLQEVGNTCDEMVGVIWEATYSYLVSLFLELNMLSWEANLWEDYMPEELRTMFDHIYRRMVLLLISKVRELF